MDILQENITKTAIGAKDAARKLSALSPQSVRNALLAMTEKLDNHRREIQKENKKDLEKGEKKGLSPAMLDRLTLSDTVIDSMIGGVRTVADLESPLGTSYDERTHENGLSISKVRVPIGVIGIIYESRPNVTVDAAAICLKSNNAVILRGGSEAFYSNTILARLFSEALDESGLPQKAVQLIDTTDRQAVQYLLKQKEYIDLIIPRGGERLIQTVVENSHIPVIKHYKGVCHLYISASADVDMAAAIAVNGKVQRPGVCNSIETILIHNSLPAADQKRILRALLDEGVTIYGDDNIQSMHEDIKRASAEDWDTEYLSLAVSIKSVDSLDEAIKHINRYSSGHTEAIVTGSREDADRFKLLVDSSSVMVNASTRFADGGEYGMGCEIGISTDKLHARGPMGVNDLTTYKWIVEGDGQVRS
ncbi:MAG: glutamate-5-semialdehyde dehydrogenase [Fibrobacterota bacterium]